MKSILSILLALFLTAEVMAASKCVQVYYDAAPDADKKYWHGRIHAMFLQNLLGHFPHIDQKIIPITQYQAGDLDKCASSIYLGTYFPAKIPDSFLQDFLNTSKNVAWAGYGVWKLGEENLKRVWGVQYDSLTTYDEFNRDEDGFPGYYKYYSYKGEEFFKFNSYEDKNDPTSFFHAAFEISRMVLIAPDAKKNVVSWARHSTSNDRIPYILNSENKWYIGDSPFSYITENDRYLIIADILFDILSEEPRHQGKKPALFRVEDVHARVPRWQLDGMVRMLRKHDIPFSMTMIPIYTDPFGFSTGVGDYQFLPMNWDPTFIEFVDFAKQSKASFIYHGVTHQMGETMNPFNGMTGSDFEFWDRVNNRPIPNDNAKFVVERLETGLTILEDSHVNPIAWLTPHYQASPLDYKIFSQLFTWNAGRVIYFPHQVQGERDLPHHMTIDNAGSVVNGERLPYFENLQVSYPKELLPNGQFFPYEIYSDVYGQKIIPENIGNVQPNMSEQVFDTNTVDDLIETLRRNRVIRDAWGSLFVHSFTLNSEYNAGIGRFAGDTRAMERLIVAAKQYGYEFIDLKEFVEANNERTRINVIER